MLVIGCVAKRAKEGKVVYHEFRDVPRDRHWAVKVLSLQCPACRRRIDGLFLGCADDATDEPAALDHPDFPNPNGGELASQLSLRFSGA